MTESRPDSQAHLVLNGISKEIAGQEILHDISLSIPRGQIFGIAGPDGSGKSSLLKILAGIWQPNAGSLELDGKTLQHIPSKLKATIGYMAFEEGLYDDLTAVENLHYTARLYEIPLSRAAPRIEELLRRTELLAFKDIRVQDFSGGMKHKLALCSALLHQPQLLLLDEPSIGIDPLSRREIWQMLFELPAEGVTVILTTTYFDEVLRCQRVALLSEGRIILTGDPRELSEGATPAVHDLEALFYRRLKEISPETVSINERAWAQYIKPIRAADVGEETQVLDVEQIYKNFGDLQAVRPASFSIRSGEIFGLIGPNGAGKTTLLRMLCGLTAPDAGSISLWGKDPFTQRELVQGQIGYMSQQFSLYQDLTVHENLEFYGGIYEISSDELIARIDWILKVTDLRQQTERRVRDLPTGWRQRFALACTLLHDPKFLFLDEPTTAVDPVTRRYFWHWISFLAQRGRTIIVTTHDMTEAAQCQRVMLMHLGSILALGSPQELAGSKSSMEDVFVEAIQRYDAEEVA